MQTINKKAEIEISKNGVEAVESVNRAESMRLDTELIAEIVAKAIAKIRIYVLEQEITDAQNAVKAVVEKATL